MPVAKRHREREHPKDGYASLIGDVIGSRRRQPQVRHEVQSALDQANDQVEAIQPMQFTIGDEFQGVYRRIGQALNAALLVRLQLHKTVDVRFGIGWGEFTQWSPGREPFEQDGPVWWTARAALEVVRKSERSLGSPAALRTAVRFDTNPDVDERTEEAETVTRDGLPLPGAIDLGLNRLIDLVAMFRDQVAHRLDKRDAELVLSILAGSTVTEAARQAGISQQAASRRLGVNGGYALKRSWDLLERTD